MEEDKKRLVVNYQKKMHLLTIGYYCFYIVMFIFVIGWVYEYFILLNISTLLFCTVLFCLIIGWYLLNIAVNMISVKFLKHIQDIALNDLDIYGSLMLYQQLINHPKRIGYIYCLNFYLKMLILSNQSELFEKTYYQNRKVLRKSSTKILESYYMIITSLQENKLEYIHMYKQFKFSQYRNNQDHLSKTKSILRYNDESTDIQYLYYTLQYEKTLEKINNAHPINAYDKIWLSSYKALSLLHLNRESEATECAKLLDTVSSDFLCVYKYYYFKEHGKDYTVDFSKTFIDDLKSDIISHKKTKKKTLVGIIIILLVLTLLISRFNMINPRYKYTNFSEIVSLRMDSTIHETYNLYENNEIAASLISASSNEEGASIRMYYLASLQKGEEYAKHIQSKVIGFKFEQDKIYSLEAIKNKVYYLSFVDKGYRSIFYNEEQVDFQSTNIQLIDGSYQTIISLVIETNEFDESLLKIS